MTAEANGGAPQIVGPSPVPWSLVVDQTKVQAPDGRLITMCVLQIFNPTGVFVLVCTPSDAAQLAHSIRQAAAQAQRDTSGLIVPPGAVTA